MGIYMLIFCINTKFGRWSHNDSSSAFYCSKDHSDMSQMEFNWSSSIILLQKTTHISFVL